MVYRDFWQDNPSNYTEIFIQLCNLREYKRSNGYNPEHPFIFFQKCFENLGDYEVEAGIWSFEEKYKLLKAIQVKEVQAMTWFRLEYSTVYIRKRDKYLNKVVDQLRHLHKQFLKEERKVGEAFREKNSQPFQNYHNPLPTLLELSIRGCFHQIFVEHQYKLSQTNWNYMYKHFELKEPIFSFKRSGKIKDENLEYHFRKSLLETGILDSGTDFRVFKNLFMRKPVLKRIEWQESLSSLAYFITSLKDEGIIENPRNKHWKIAYEFFTHNGLPITNLKKLGEPRKDLKDTIDHFIVNVHSNFEK